MRVLNPDHPNDRVSVISFKQTDESHLPFGIEAKSASYILLLAIDRPWIKTVVSSLRFSGTFWSLLSNQRITLIV